jgi:L-ascorbate metabolism protein UlaG (beta-lactamase superfamily)
MELTWLEGSCFRLHASGLQIVTDPFDLPPGSPPQSGDVVTTSRRLPRERLHLGDVYRVVDGPGDYEIRGVPITGIATARKAGAAGAAGAPGAAGAGAAGDVWAGRNVVYTLVLDGITVCHLGRLDQGLTAGQLQELGSPAVVLLCLGEAEGLAAAPAVQLVSQLEARLLVPVPLGGAPGEAAVERFCRELGADPQNVSPRLSVTASGLPAQTQVVRLLPGAPSGPGSGGPPDA